MRFYFYHVVADIEQTKTSISANKLTENRRLLRGDVSDAHLASLKLTFMKAQNLLFEKYSRDIRNDGSIVSKTDYTLQFTHYTIQTTIS